MIAKVVKKSDLDSNSGGADLAYWLSKSHRERIEAVEILRNQFDGSTKGLQRTIRIIQRPQS